MDVISQIAEHNIMNDQLLQRCWKDTVLPLVPASATDDTVISVGRMLTLKMLHSQFKEFITGTRILETLKEGKSADVDVALRVKLKTHASLKHIHLHHHSRLHVYTYDVSRLQSCRGYNI